MPESCGVQYVLQYLQSRLDEGLAATTLRGYLAAVSACHVGWMDRPVGRHPLVSRFMKGVSPASSLDPSMAWWDLDVVLAALATVGVCLPETPLYEGGYLGSDYFHEEGGLHAFLVSSECYQMDPGGRSISLRHNTSFLLKVLSDRHVNIPFVLSAYDTPAVAGESGPPSGMLCPVRALAAYMERTRSVRTTDQLFVCYGERILEAGLSSRGSLTGLWAQL